MATGEYQRAKEILEKGFWIPLPSKYDVDAYEIMEEFCLSIENDMLSDKMLSSIKGSGAFRRFKENIKRYNIEYRFRDDALKEIAIDWCQ